MRGVVSALSVQPTVVQGSHGEQGQGMLAAGTWTRWVGLYDVEGFGGTVATWDISAAADKDAGIGGAGVSQTVWSPCGRYLLVVERKSRGVLVYDVRVTGRLVGWLEGREAETNQRLVVDAIVGGGEDPGCEVWAGGMDGTVRVWRDVGMEEGGKKVDWEWKAHEDPVTSSIVHPSRTVMATCSGQRAFPTTSDEVSGSESETESLDTESDESSARSSHDSDLLEISCDNSIKIWSL